MSLAVPEFFRGDSRNVQAKEAVHLVKTTYLGDGYIVALRALSLPLPDLMSTFHLTFAALGRTQAPSAQLLHLANLHSLTFQPSRPNLLPTLHPHDH